MADLAAENARPGSTTNSAAASNAASRASTPGASAEKPPDDSSKFKTFLSILRKYVARQPPRNDASDLAPRRFIGVSDLAAVRFSLPAQLLEPRPNLGTSKMLPCIDS